MACSAGCTCGCCEGTAARAPILPDNPPLLPAISYRSGDWQSFRDTMLARLGSADAGVLAGLSTRDPQDPTIALIDAWAVAGDILTFYNERLLSENLLRTAQEPDSAHQLARLIGYRPAPGVAASADVAFNMDPSVGAPGRAVLAAGLKVQSTPTQDKPAVTYETTQAIEARPAWNALRPRLDQPHQLDGATTQLWIEGHALSALAGDGVYWGGTGGPFFGLITGIERLAGDRLADPEARDFTRLNIRLLPEGPIHDAAMPLFMAFAVPPAPADAYLDRIIDAGDFAAETTAAGHDPDQIFATFASAPPPRPFVTLFRARAPIFGHAAPPFATLPIALTGSVPNYEVSDGVVVANGVITGPFAGQSANWADGMLTVLDTGTTATTYLEGTQALLARGDQVVLRDGDAWISGVADSVAETSISRFSISGKAAMVQLTSASGFDALSIRGTTAFFAPETVFLTRPPLTLPLTDGSAVPMPLQGYAPGLQAGQRIAISGRRVGDGQTLTTQIATIDEVVHDFHLGGGTSIRFSPALSEDFDRASVRINANIAPATHGESVAEMLGDGDAARPFLTLRLTQAPLTHVTDASPSGASPALELRVNDILWSEVPHLLDSGPKDRVYTTVIDPAGKTTIRFGDGLNGARPPTGSQNVRARFRKGLGLQGRVGAGALNILMSRPLGLSSAVNPLPSSGGADPEGVDEIRANAPLTVRTLDRAVSAIDYQDLAQGYAGIAKAEARLLADGVAQFVHLTVAGEEAEQILPGSALHAGLAAAIAEHSDPYRRALISSFRPATFRVGAMLKTDPAHLPDVVLAAVAARLRADFGFAARRFSQTVWMSEIVAALHQVPGVVAVDMTRLYRDLDPDGTPLPVANLPGLFAQPMRMTGAGEALGAELLTLHPGPLDQITVMS